MNLEQTYSDIKVLPSMKPDCTGTLAGGLVALYKKQKIVNIAAFYGGRLYLNQDKEARQRVEN